MHVCMHVCMLVCVHTRFSVTAADPARQYGIALGIACIIHVSI